MSLRAVKSLRLVAFVLGVAVTPFASAVTYIYPVDAIDDLMNLAADEFKQKYAGINVTDLGSANGTRVVTPDGRTFPLTPGIPHRATPGDRIELGRTVVGTVAVAA